MFELYKIWAILIWGIIILLLVLVLSLFVFYYRIVHGKARRIIGEITRDIGIALLVGSAFK